MFEATYSTPVSVLPDEAGLAGAAEEPEEDGDEGVAASFDAVSFDAEALPFAGAGSSSSSSVCCASGIPMVYWPLTLPVASPNWSISSPLTV